MVAVDNAPGNIETEPGPLTDVLGREERIENAGGGLGRHTGSAVLHLDDHLNRTPLNNGGLHRNRLRPETVDQQGQEEQAEAGPSKLEEAAQNAEKSAEANTVGSSARLTARS